MLLKVGFFLLLDGNLNYLFYSANYKVIITFKNQHQILLMLCRNKYMYITNRNKNLEKPAEMYVRTYIYIYISDSLWLCKNICLAIRKGAAYDVWKSEKRNHMILISRQGKKKLSLRKHDKYSENNKDRKKGKEENKKFKLYNFSGHLFCTFLRYTEKRRSDV